MKGNPDVHVILRGGSSGPNYAAEYVRDCGAKLAKAGFPQKIMVSLGPSRTNVFSLAAISVRSTAAMGTARSNTDVRLMSRRTLYVFTTVGQSTSTQLSPQARQLDSGDTSAMIMGVMIESNLVEGRQDIPVSGPSGLTYGQSVTGKSLTLWGWLHALTLSQMHVSHGNKRSQCSTVFVRVSVVGGFCSRISQGALRSSMVSTVLRQMALSSLSLPR